MSTLSYDEDYVAEVLGQVSIIDVAQVIHNNDIRKLNAELWTASCPFHNERTPSMRMWHYEEDSQPDSFYCFGCCKGGNVISYVMHSYGKSPDEAFRFICNEFGFDDPLSTSSSPLQIKLKKLFSNKSGASKNVDVLFDVSITIRDILKEIKVTFGSDSEEYAQAVKWVDREISLVNTLFTADQSITTLEKLFSQYRKRWFKKRSEFLNI